MNETRFPGVVAARQAGRILADNAASSQIPDEALAAVARYLTYDNAQKSTLFARSIRTNEIVEEARASFGELLDVDASTIGFGANATSIALDFARTLAHVIRAGDRVAVTATDHYANVMPWRWLERFGAVVDIIEVDDHGELLDASLTQALEHEPLVVAFPYASNATGNVFDVGELARRAGAAGALVVVDCVQGAPHLALDMTGIDFAFFSTYKLFAPHFGVWYARPEVQERFFSAEDPLLPSAPINWSMETGTQNFEGLAGWLGTAAYLREIGKGSLRAGMEHIAAYELVLSRAALAGFAERNEGMELYGETPEFDRLPVFAFNVRGVQPERVGKILDEALIEGRVGDYYVPRLMQQLAPEYGGSAIRLSFAHYNTLDEVERCFAVIDGIESALLA